MSVPRLLRAAASLCALVGLLAGPPLLLLAIGQLPDGLPSAVDWWETGLEQALPVLLTVASWAVWAYFVGCVLLEVALMLRRGRVRPPQRPGPRGLAATLLGGILLLPAAQAATAGTAAAALVSETAVPHSPGPGQQDRVAPAAQEYPVHRVGAARETVWDIAERYFGTGDRVTDIRDLNTRLGNPLPEDVTLPAGTAVYLPRSAVPEDSEVSAEPLYTVPGGGLTLEDIAREQLGDAGRAGDVAALNPGVEADLAGDGTVRAGTVLAMPSDYTPPRDEEEEGDGRATQAEVTVETGDTLWALSEEHLGDPTRYPEIHRENLQVIGPDPDVLYPGQELVIPGSRLADPVPEAPAERPERDAGDSGQQDDGREQQDDRQDQEREVDAGGPGTAAPGEGPSAPPQPDPAPEREVSARGNGREASVPAAVAALAGAGVLAAGMLGLLTRRRVLQQRIRRPGRRIPRPQGTAASVEQAMRHVEVGDQLDHLRRAVMTAAVHLAAGGRDLPALAAVTLTETRATLHLAEEETPVPPFLPDGAAGGVEASRAWHVAAGSGQVLPADAEELRDVEPPYPALVTLGRTTDGGLVLVDLEQVGAVQLVGERRSQVLRTLAAELAVTQVTDDLELAVVGDVAPGLEQLGHAERMTRYGGAEAALPVLRAQCRDQQAALEAVGAGHLRQARLSGDLEGAWAPLVVLAEGAGPGEDEALRQLLEVVASGPRAAAAVVTTTASGDAGGLEGVWVVDTTPGAAVTVPGTGVEVVLEPLGDEEYADLVEIGSVALLETDVPPDGPGEGAAAAGGSGAGPAEEDAGVVTAGPPADVDQPSGEVAGGPSGAAGLDLIGSLAPPVHGGEENDAADGDSAGADETLVPAPAAAPPPDDGPMIRVLGPVDIIGARGTVASARRRSLLEPAVWIALHPGASARAMDEALWPFARDRKNTRSPLLSKLRAWLGRDDDGELYLPRGLYAYTDRVRCDWLEFQRLVAEARRASGPDFEGLMHQALELVRGRPFEGIDPRRYVWAEHDINDMISAIADAATELAEYYMDTGAPRAALWAASRGLVAAEETERLHRIVFRAHHALGDREGLERAAARLDSLLEGWQIDMEESTARLLGELLERRPAGRER